VYAGVMAKHAEEGTVPYTFDRNLYVESLEKKRKMFERQTDDNGATSASDIAARDREAFEAKKKLVDKD